MPRDRWPSGPWDNEPDEVTWTYGTEQGQVRCRVDRGRLGQLNGYVEIPAGHPWYAVTDIWVSGVHGGLTFAEFAGFEPEQGWWVGFDCGHFQDVIPGLIDVVDLQMHVEQHYWTFEEVSAETVRLAEQAISAMATTSR